MLVGPDGGRKLGVIVDVVVEPDWKSSKSSSSNDIVGTEGGLRARIGAAAGGGNKGAVPVFRIRALLDAAGVLERDDGGGGRVKADNPPKLWSAFPFT